MDACATQTAQAEAPETGDAHPGSSLASDAFAKSGKATRTAAPIASRAYGHHSTR